MKNLNLFLVALTALITISSCKKDPDPQIPTTPSSDMKSEVLVALSTNVVQATYNDLSAKTTQLYNAILELDSTTTDGNLTNCKQYWRESRAAWEQSEAFLFGPVESGSYDPHMDTWPVNYTDMDSLLSSSAVFTDPYINSLQDALRGFHPIEYLLFGTHGDKVASSFTTREKQYLIALATNLKNLTSQVEQSWNPSISGNYNAQFINAGHSGSVYATQRAAYEEIVNAMADICNEVASSKMEGPYAAGDPSLEESPFSFNSITDFTNNIRSAQNVYLGKYITDGKGLEDLVRENNLSLDGTIKTKFNNAIASLNAITVPFGQAISTQRVQVENAIAAINDLKSTLETDLLAYVQHNTN